MPNTGKNIAERITYQISGLNTIEALTALCEAFPGEVTFSSSFSFEDQVITHDILSNKLPVSIFTLDTGRLFAETYAVWSSTNERYQTHIKAFYPRHDILQDFIEEKGPNAFY